MADNNNDNINENDGIEASPEADIEAAPVASSADESAATSKKDSSLWRLIAVGAVSALLVLLVLVAINSLGGKSDQQDAGNDVDVQANEREFSFTVSPSQGPSLVPSMVPTFVESQFPTDYPTSQPTLLPSSAPSRVESQFPSSVPTHSPTSAPSSVPSGSPSFPPTPLPSAGPSSSPSDAPTKFEQCGMDFTAIPGQVKGVDDKLFGSFKEFQDEYTDGNPFPFGDNDGLRKLAGSNNFLDVLNEGVNLFRAATNIFTFFDAARKNKEFRNYVRETLDGLDTKIDGIAQQVEDGFNGLKNYIDKKSVQEYLDSIKTGLSNLRLGHEQYRTHEIHLSFLQSNREAFHGLCKGMDSRPVSLYQKLYSVGCGDCNLWPDIDSEDVIGFYIEEIRASSLDEAERIGAFRHMIGDFIILSMFESMFYHAACVYTMELSCNSESAWWTRTMDRMTEGMVEVVQNLLEREKELWGSSMPSMAPSIAPTYSPGCKKVCRKVRKFLGLDRR